MKTTSTLLHLSAFEIHNRMIQIEEKLNILEHNLTLKFGNRLDRDNNSDSQIKNKINILDSEWDDLALSLVINKK